MGTISLNRLGAWSLIVGPVLAFVFFLIQPGVLFIERADPTDGMASVAALSSNGALTNLTALVAPLGLVMTVFGIYVVQTGLRGNGSGDALSRSALALILTGNVGWVMSSGLLFSLAGAEDAAGPVAQAVFAVRSGITLVSSVAVALGFGLFAVALSTREDFNKIAALIVAAVSIVSLLGFIIVSRLATPAWPGRR